MKKFLPVLLIVLISLNTFGFNLILEYLIYSCKIHFAERVEHNLDSEKIVVFKKSAIEKEINYNIANEFEYKSRMYDVIKREVKNGETLIYCLNDEVEDNLNKIIDEQNDKRNYPTKINFILKSLTKLFLNPSKINHQLYLNNSLYVILDNKNYISQTREVISPPPNFII